MIVLAYLVAIVAANLVVATVGPGATIVVAFFAIGFDLTARDRLHDRWRGHHLLLRMTALIAAGGLLSFLVNGAAGPIAIASTIAFAASAVADALVYAALEDRDRLVRTNGSNIAGAAVDSIIFPTLAFGGFLPLIAVGQFLAKTVGGFAWSLVVRR